MLSFKNDFDLVLTSSHTILASVWQNKMNAENKPLHRWARASFTLAAAVVEVTEVNVVNQANILGVLKDSEVTEDILVWHLDAEGPLSPQSAYSLLDVDCPDVGQTPRTDVHRDKCA